MDEPDLASWIRGLGREQPWDYELLRAVARAYLCVNRSRRAAARRALPGIEAEASLWWALRPGRRRN